MTIDLLKSRLLSDLQALNIDTKGFKLTLKPFSKTYYGRYKPNIKEVIVYVYEDSNQTNLFPYEKIFSTALHESVHHMQWSNPDFKRIKGVMHNAEFYLVYNRLMRKHKIYRTLKRRC